MENVVTEEFISRTEALKALFAPGMCYAPMQLQIVKDLPAVDVAEVVRCRDCIYRIEGRCFSRTSFLNAPAVEPDNFCSWGATE